MQRATSFSQIKSIPLPELEIEIPEWDCIVVIRKMTTGDQELIFGAVKPGDTQSAMIAQRKAFLASVVVPTIDTGEFDNLKNLDGQAVTRIYDAILDFNGLGDKAKAALAKN